LAYAASNNGIMPFIIRPPMTGRVRVRGTAVVHRYHGSADEVVLFLGRVRFMPANKVAEMDFLDQAVKERIAFSARFSGGDPDLPNIRATIPLRQFDAPTTRASTGDDRPD